jgi:hypothetical protein
LALQVNPLNAMQGGERLQHVGHIAQCPWVFCLVAYIGEDEGAVGNPTLSG